MLEENPAKITVHLVQFEKYVPFNLLQTLSYDFHHTSTLPGKDRRSQYGSEWEGGQRKEIDSLVSPHSARIYNI